MIDLSVLDAYRWVRRGCRRKKILLFLGGRQKPVTGMEVSRQLGISIKRVSDTLCEMRRKGLVEVMNPEARFDRRYRVTALGRDVCRNGTL